VRSSADSDFSEGSSAKLIQILSPSQLWSGVLPFYFLTHPGSVELPFGVQAQICDFAANLAP